MSDMNQRVIAEFRANDGRVGGFFANHTLLILHTMGAKSGRERLNPLITHEVDGQLVIVASNAGAPAHPAWYYNLVANPLVTVEYGTETFAARADVAEEPLRSELFEKMTAVFPRYGEYQAKVERTIPVITLSRLK